MRVQAVCHDLACRGRERLNTLTGLPPIVPAAPGWFGQMATVMLPACDHEALQRRFFDEFAIEIPTFAWNGGSYLRLSVQAYNDEADVDALVHALACLLSGAT